MTNWNLIQNLNKQFEAFEMNSSFYIRERVYRGSHKIETGLVETHKEIKHIMNNLKKHDIHEDYLKINGKDLENIILKLQETLNLCLLVAETLEDHNQINKLIKVVSIEINELDAFIAGGLLFDPSKVETEEEMLENRISELKAIIEDNLLQIKSTFEWKRYKHSSIGDEIKAIAEIDELIDTSTIISLNVQGLDNLTLLSLIATNIRGNVGEKLLFLGNHLEMFITLSQILTTDESIADGDLMISPDDVRKDIERKVNLKKLEWVVLLHSSIMDEYPRIEFPKRFARLVYKLSRDAREEFLWTMTKIARDQSNTELEDLSIAYANLASMLLSIEENLKEAGLNDLARAIHEVEEIKALDAIDDLGELYGGTEIGVSNLVKAIRKQLKSLKAIAFQVIQMEDLRPTFQMIVEFTDMEADLDAGTSLEDYITNIGDSNQK